ncbi:MAG: MmgE/PrpD family protein [Clostridiales Family XIII bacterium]|jgi:2-methylcitrate dehydratase PrpD|nr:MmgE/PrpD family protein [Clostridiales Family XIII bacterium]
MKKEQQFAKFVHETRYEDLPGDVIEGVKRQVVAIYAASMAGNRADGIEAIAGLSKELGGKGEATILIHGGKVPAHTAAFVNSAMARAWDICDHIAPGPHIGASCIPASLAAAELIGGCSGKDLITAIAVGTEVGLRLNLEEYEYDGFDPTGIVAGFAATAAASWLLKLDEDQIMNALALAFNRCGGSFQSHADGALAVRVIEGWCSETGIECARLAQLGITGPENFLDGVYGYFYLYGRGKKDTEKTVTGFGKIWNGPRLNFKKYPSCGLTQGTTQLALDMIGEHGFAADDVEKVEILIPPFTYKLVGEFKLGKNPKVDAQFSTAYCIANALVRPPVRLVHFEPDEIRDPGVLGFLKEKVVVVTDESIAHTRGHYSSDLVITLKDGRALKGSIDVPPGTPEYPMTEEEHKQRFYECMEFADRPWLSERADDIFRSLKSLEAESDVRTLFAKFQS